MTKYYVMREAICYWEDEEIAICNSKEEAEKIAKALNNTTNNKHYVIEW